MASNNRNFTDNLGFGLDLWYETSPFVANAGGYNTNSKRVIAHGPQGGSGIESLFTKTFFRKGGVNAAGQPGGSIFVKSSLNENTDEFLNNTSLTEIITYLQQWRATYVDYSDFAYLKNLGVYPTNRLMIVRRFPAPVGNNLFEVDADPLATLITWVPENTDFFSVTFGEVWEKGETSLLNVLNDIGKDVGIGKDSDGGLGSIIQQKLTGKLLPGFAEKLQIELAKQLGFAGDYDVYNPPISNPNYINQSMRRKLHTKDTPGGDTGLMSGFTITFNAEYEMKFINGVDPSTVYQDLIHKSLIFGTSKSVFMFNSDLGGSFGDFTKDLMSGEISTLLVRAGNIIIGLGKAILDLVTGLAAQGVQDLGSIFTGNDSILKKFVTYLLSRHRLKIIAAIQAMTGAAQGYYHVTIGNPKKPIFSSGDLILGESGVTLKLGQKLGYNDLPSTLSVGFMLIPTRSLGGQEIFDKLNTGTGRTYHQFDVSWVEQRFDPNLISGGAQGFEIETQGTTYQSSYEAFKKRIGFALGAQGAGKSGVSGNPGPNI